MILPSSGLRKQGETGGRDGEGERGLPSMQQESEGGSSFRHIGPHFGLARGRMGPACGHGMLPWA